MYRATVEIYNAMKRGLCNCLRSRCSGKKRSRTAVLYLLHWACGISICICVACTSKSRDTDGADREFADSLAGIVEENPLETNHVDTVRSDLKAQIDSTDAVMKKRFNNYIYISKPKMRLYVLDKKDSVLFSCGIACGARRGDKTGKGDFRTPEGEFRICGIYNSTDWIHKTPDGRKVKGCYGPIFLSLATPKFTGIGIHGTNAPRSIGKRASEGCIRVNSNNILIIKEKYAFGGMQVIVSGEHERLPFKDVSDKTDALSAENNTKPDSLNKPDSNPEQAPSPVDSLTVHPDSSGASPGPVHADSPKVGLKVAGGE